MVIRSGTTNATIRFSLLVLLLQVASGSDPTQPHYHSGKLKSFSGSKIELKLDIDEETKLNSQGVVIRKTVLGDGGRGIVIQDINASPQACMSTIKNVGSYAGLVPHVLAADVYSTDTAPDGTSSIKAKLKAGMYGFNYEYFLHLIHRPAENTLTWTLDYTRRSDIDDSVGHWQVEAHPHKSGWTRVFYSTELALPKMIPSFVINYLTKNVLSESTQWVKLEAEKQENELKLKQTDTSESCGAVPESVNVIEDKSYKFPRFGFIGRTKKWLSRRE